MGPPTEQPSVCGHLAWRPRPALRTVAWSLRHSHRWKTFCHSEDSGQPSLSLPDSAGVRGAGVRVRRRVPHFPGEARTSSACVRLACWLHTSCCPGAGSRMQKDEKALGPLRKFLAGARTPNPRGPAAGPARLHGMVLGTRPHTAQAPGNAPSLELRGQLSLSADQPPVASWGTQRGSGHPPSVLRSASGPSP